MIQKQAFKQLAALPILWQIPHSGQGTTNNLDFSKKY
jgi:hypothetical protein